MLSARRRAAFAAILMISLPSAAQAQLPDPVRDMIDAAIATGDEQTVRTVIGIARQTNPDEAAALDAILSDFEADLALAEAEQEAAREEEIRTAGLFSNWSGKGELGFFNSTGNAENTGLTASFSLVRQGINWRHKLRGRADYQESNGVTTREQFLAAYEPNLQISDRLFAFALAQYERDRFQGFSARYSLSGGLGANVIVEDDMTLSVQAGPAYRRTELIGGETLTNLAGNASLDFDWQIADMLTFTQDASAFVQSGSSTFISDSGLQASIASDVSVRLSYTVEYDTEPPLGAENTDTLSRITIVYDF